MTLLIRLAKQSKGKHWVALFVVQFWYFMLPIDVYKYQAQSLTAVDVDGRRRSHSPHTEDGTCLIFQNGKYEKLKKSQFTFDTNHFLRGDALLPEMEIIPFLFYVSGNICFVLFYFFPYYPVAIFHTADDTHSPTFSRTKFTIHIV